MKLDPYLTPYAKTTSRLIIHISLRAKTKKLLEENVSITLFDWIRLCFLSYSPKPLTTKGKADRLDIIKIKSFCGSKEDNSKGEIFYV